MNDQLVCQGWPSLFPPSGLLLAVHQGLIKPIGSESTPCPTTGQSYLLFSCTPILNIITQCPATLRRINCTTPTLSISRSHCFLSLPNTPALGPSSSCLLSAQSPQEIMGRSRNRQDMTGYTSAWPFKAMFIIKMVVTNKQLTVPSSILQI